jgi:hypothetical protein
MIDQATAKQLLKILEYIRKRPMLFFADVIQASQSPTEHTWNTTVNSAWNFINGFNAALSVFGINALNDHINREITIERGWTWTAQSVRFQMHERGMTDSEIIEELLTIEIEAMKRRFDIGSEDKNDHETHPR